MKYRDIYEVNPLCNPLTQGSILNNCFSESFPDCNVWGLVITPRCDLAHTGKVSTLHYLPVIQLNDWIKTVGIPSILSDYKKDLASKINSYFRESGIDFNITDKFDSEEELKKLAESHVNKNKKLKELNDTISKFCAKDFSVKNIDKKTLKKKLDTLCHHLTANDNRNFYCLEHWAVNENPLLGNIVILLREVRRIPIDVGLKFSTGFYRNSFTEEELKNYDMKSKGQPDDIFLIEANIKSPYIEHIMQAFNYNFCRIGVEDSFDEREKSIANHLSSLYS